MSLLLSNGVTGSYAVPTVNRPAYRYTAFKETLTLSAKGDDGKVLSKTLGEMDTPRLYSLAIVTQKLTDAWKFVSQQAVYRPCNNYFKTLPRGWEEYFPYSFLSFHSDTPEKQNRPFDEKNQPSFQAIHAQRIGIEPKDFGSLMPQSQRCRLRQTIWRDAGNCA